VFWRSCRAVLAKSLAQRERTMSPANRDPQKDAEIRALLAYEPLYHQRLKWQGWDGRPGFRIFIKNRGYLETTWREDRARTAVHDGTIKALTTRAIPGNISNSAIAAAWLRAIDRNARTDADRVEVQYNATHAIMRDDYKETEDGGIGIGRQALPGEEIQPTQDSIFEAHEMKVMAVKHLVAAACAVNIDASTMRGVAWRLVAVKAPAWSTLARGTGVGYKTFQKRVEAAIERLQARLRVTELELVRLFAHAVGVLTPQDSGDLDGLLDALTNVFQNTSPRSSLFVKGLL
jgi:hypothetical protein